MELTDDEKLHISRKLLYALENNCRILITYFIPDKTKSGGSYKRVSGTIKKWDEDDKTLILKNGNIIPVEFISEIEIKDNGIEI